VERRQPPADVQAQPEQRGQLRVGQVGVEVAGDVEERLLEDIRCVEAGPDARVDAEFDHATEPIAVAIEQGRQRPAVAAAERPQRVGRIAEAVVHDGPHTLYPRAGQKAGPDTGDRDRQQRSRAPAGSAWYHAWRRIRRCRDLLYAAMRLVASKWQVVSSAPPGTWAAVAPHSGQDGAYQCRWRAVLRASVGSTERNNFGSTGFGGLGPTRATPLQGQAG